MPDDNKEVAAPDKNVATIKKLTNGFIVEHAGLQYVAKDNYDLGILIKETIYPKD